MQHETKTNRRHLFGFANGIYNALSDRFHAFSDETENKPELLACEVLVGRFNRYTLLAQHFGATESMQFTNADWRHICDPILDPIIAYQQLSEEQEWHLWASIGRLLYDVNTTDSWERTLVVSGRSPCGLGVLTRRIASIYPRDRVTVPVFHNDKACSLMAQTAYLGLLDEVSLPQMNETHFVRMTSGEYVADGFLASCSAADNFSAKTTAGFGSSSSLNASRGSDTGKKLESLEDETRAVTVLPLLPSPWRAPLLVASHTLPDWMHPENKHSSWRVIRRLTYIPFKNRVDKKHIDPLLLHSAAHNVAIGNFILKANRAYRQMLKGAKKRHAYRAVQVDEDGEELLEEEMHGSSSSFACPIPSLVESARKLKKRQRSGQTKQESAFETETTNESDCTDSSE